SFLVKLNTRQCTRVRTGGDNDMFGNQLFAVIPRNCHCPAVIYLGLESGLAIEVIDLIFSKQIKQTLVVLINNSVFAPQKGIDIELEPLDLDPVITKLLFSLFVVFAGL